jgi:predicted GIY-YIG superfamily endonuclease
MAFFVYILKCSDDSYYVGHTEDLERRLFEHNNKVFKGFTSSRLPVQLMFKQQFDLRDDAFVAERKIKDWSRKKKALIAGDLELLRECSKKKF